MKSVHEVLKSPSLSARTGQRLVQQKRRMSHFLLTPS